METRGVWIQLARKRGTPIRCLYFTAPAKVCEHNDTVRALNSGVFNPEKRSILPHSAFSSFLSRFREPQLKEGFEDIVVIPFQVIYPVFSIGSRLTCATVPGRESGTSYLESVLDMNCKSFAVSPSRGIFRKRKFSHSGDEWCSHHGISVVAQQNCENAAMIYEDLVRRLL